MPQAEFDLKINLVSVLNLLGILGILGTALWTGYSFLARVDALVIEVSGVKQQILDVNVRMSNTVAERKAENDALKAKDDFIVKTISDIQTQNIERMARVETELKSLGQSVGKLEGNLQRWMERQIRSQPP